MKFYTYISDTKVDMLYAQIPISVRNKVATELKIDLQVLSTTFKQDSAETTRFSKLKVVTEYVEKHEKVGTIDSPSFFFRGVLPMRWGKLFDTDAVYFGGITKKTVLGLSGSGKHVIGEVGTSETGLPGSGATFLMQLIQMDAHGASLLKENNEGITEEQKKALQTLAKLQGWDTGEDRINQLLLSVVKSITENTEGPVQKLEFLAKRLIEGYDLRTNPSNPEAKRILLGSPIYIALAE